MIKLSISGNEYSLVDFTDIETICLFGSSVRGDNDDLSDIDLFVIINDCDENSFVKTKGRLADVLRIPVDWISLYRKSTVISMHKYGSYFLWHIKAEGKTIYSREGFIEEILNTLPPYTRVRNDLLEYLEICEDIRKSIAADNITLNFELSVLASLVRNTCIAFCYLHGKLIFGRVSPIRMSQQIMGESKFPFTIQQYKDLYSFRIARIRGVIKPNVEASYSLIETWLNDTEFLIKYCLDKGETKNDY
jgi:predicted nucleotidyltransferase